MNDRFSIAIMPICTFYIKEGFVYPNTEYPSRLCVIDNKNNIVVDVKNELKYDYIKTMSNLYVINESIKKIRENKRAAIYPATFLIDVSDYDRQHAENIMERLQAEEEFRDGNEALSNEEYLESLKNELVNEENSNVKIRKKKK